jgi:hypothetical protein
MSFVLLTGAGFSYNWGGWLANEVFEYLLGCTEINDNHRKLLWDCKRAGGFEDALAQLQQNYNLQKSPADEKALRDMEAAIVGMFNYMNQSLAKAQFEPQNDMAYLVRTFLAKFDAIFTLNQDLLLEHHYLDGNIALAQSRKWNGWSIPGMKLLNPNPPVFDPAGHKTAMLTPDPANMRESPGAQPYFKLHGSTNWLGGESQTRLLVMGGNKSGEINRHPVLTWYHKRFREYLSGARLMVIGYSFGDHHINEMIMEAADSGLRLFIVDPQGVDVLNKQNPMHMQVASALMSRLQPRIMGASRRSFTATFGRDRVEHAKLMRFFD